MTIFLQISEILIFFPKLVPKITVRDVDQALGPFFDRLSTKFCNIMFRCHMVRNPPVQCDGASKKRHRNDGEL